MKIVRLRSLSACSLALLLPTLGTARAAAPARTPACDSPPETLLSAAQPGAAKGTFSVSEGQVVGPDGKPFVARGINVFPGQVDADTILSTFPGINMVRVAAKPSTDRSTLDALVRTLSANGVVVLIEDHSARSGNPNTSSGDALAREKAWYASLASAYKANPYVWFGTANEPDNTADPQAIVAQETGIYNAVRDAGNNAPVMLQMRGGYTNDFARKYASDFALMHNVIWDTHFYGWIPGYKTDTRAIANALQKQIADAQSVQSADGTVPVIIGEYGISTTGLGEPDANGMQVVQAVHSSGYGTLAWAWNAGTDTLTSGRNFLTPFGREVARHIRSFSDPTRCGPAGPTPQHAR